MWALSASAVYEPVKSALFAVCLLFRFNIGVRLGRKPQPEKSSAFVCFLQCSWLSSRSCFQSFERRFLEGNDYSCSWPLSRQVRTTVSTARYRCIRLHAWPSASFLLTRSLVVESSPIKYISAVVYPFLLLSSVLSEVVGHEWSPHACCRSSLGAQLPSCRHRPCSSSDSRSRVGQITYCFAKNNSPKIG